MQRIIKEKKALPVYILSCLYFLIACGGEQTSTNHPLTEFEIRHGVGPIKQEVVITPWDSMLAEKGRKIFQTRCTSCHRLDRKLVGPPLRYVVRRRSDSYIMNAILNPVEMSLRHPEARKLVQRYGSQMTPQFLTEPQARQLLHYLYQQSGTGLARGIPDGYNP